MEYLLSKLKTSLWKLNFMIIPAILSTKNSNRFIRFLQYVFKISYKYGFHIHLEKIFDSYSVKEIFGARCEKSLEKSWEFSFVNKKWKKIRGLSLLLAALRTVLSNFVEGVSQLHWSQFSNNTNFIVAERLKVVFRGYICLNYDFKL